MYKVSFGYDFGHSFDQFDKIDADEGLLKLLNRILSVIYQYFVISTYYILTVLTEIAINFGRQATVQCVMVGWSVDVSTKRYGFRCISVGTAWTVNHCLFSQFFGGSSIKISNSKLKHIWKLSVF